MIMIPLPLTLLFYRVFLWIFKHKVKSFHKSMNWTTLFYIIAVDLLLVELFSGQFIGYILLILLSILLMIVIIQWKREIDINHFKAIKLMWRISFLTFSISYIILLLLWLITYI
ncbi:DUF3397 family protein [Ornithinibacillus halophilus]|nr:DUF3397 family protein [Ornithinibacillus halophilus]